MGEKDDGRSGEVFAGLEIAWVTMPSRECDDRESTPIKKTAPVSQGRLKLTIIKIIMGRPVWGRVVWTGTAHTIDAGFRTGGSGGQGRQRTGGHRSVEDGERATRRAGHQSLEDYSGGWRQSGGRSGDDRA